MAIVAIFATVLGAMGASGCARDEGPSVLVIGDSLTVGAEMLGLGGDGWTIDAEEGRSTATAIERAQAIDPATFERVIVAVGTNDYTDSESVYAARIDEMMAALGSTVPVTWVNVDVGTPTLAPAAAGVNAALAAAPARHANLTVADWSAYVAGLGDEASAMRAGDGVHYTNDGYRLRSTWMASLASG